MEKLKPPVEKNEYIDVAFEDLTHDGAGVAKVNGFPIFVQNALPGESGQVKVIKVKKAMRLASLSSTIQLVSSVLKHPVRYTSSAEAVSCSM